MTRDVGVDAVGARIRLIVGLVLGPRADRVADPEGLVRHRLAPHHQRHRADRSVPPMRRRREDHAVRAEGRAAPEDDPVHGQHPVVEQVRLHDAALVDGGPVAELDQVGLGQPVGLAPDAAADLRAHRAEPDVEQRRSRSTARANHGAATTSTKVSASSLRHTNELHSGWSLGPEPADQQPLRRGRAAPAASAARRPSARAQRRRGPPRGPARSSEQLEDRARRRAQIAARRPCTGTSAAQLDQRRGRPCSRRGGCVGAAVVAGRRPGAAAWPAGCPATTCPAFAGLAPRRRREHRDQRLLGHLAARRRPCRSCRRRPACRS